MSSHSKRRVTVEQSEPENRQSVFSRLGPGAPNRSEEVNQNVSVELAR